MHRPGERSDKHQHRIEEALGLPPEQVAVLAVLLLRGPQTPGELRSRTERMHAFGSFEEVARVLDALADRDEPLVIALERQAGRKETRYTDLLVGNAASPAAPATGASLPDPPLPEPSGVGQSLDDLVEEVAALRAEVRALTSRVEELGG